MKNFLSFIDNQEDIISLEEKLIMYNQGKKYGQVVFLAGGAGSGKGFAIKNFMEAEKFKIRDVDAWKEAFLKMSATKDKYAELRGLKLNQPKDVFRLHMFVKDRKIQDKSLDLLLSNAGNAATLPNIIFDVTLKDIGDINEVMPKLLSVGYDPKNIHITWVLTDYTIAVSRNKGRARIVPDDILLKTHEGAAITMAGIIKKSIPKNVNGEIRVILNNGAVFYANEDGSPVKNGKDGKNMPVKDFDYVTLKKAGKPIENNDRISKMLDGWIEKNIPKSRATQDILPSRDS